MKKTILLIASIILCYSCNNEKPLPPNTYEITGTAKGLVNGLRAYIHSVENKRPVTIDTAIIMNEAFTFRGNVYNPSIKTLTINSVEGSLSFVLEQGKSKINVNKDSLLYSLVSGTKNNEDYNTYKSNYRKRSGAINVLNIEYRNAKTQDERNNIVEKARKTTSELDDFSMDFIANNPDSDLSLLLLETQITNKDINLEKLKNNYNALQAVINKNAAYKAIGNKIKNEIAIIEASANLNIGKIAPNFTAPSIGGEMISLNDIKGKATIVEFWASWCGPCRRENPNIVKVYEKYKDKGLEIIGVSLDRPDQKARWEKAIEDDNLKWLHVGSLQYFNDPVARLYNVSAIPASFILDAEGKIVAKNLRGSALEEQISKMLD